MIDRGPINPKELVAVDIEGFRHSTRDIGFDVYLKLAEDNVAHVFSRTTGIDYKRLAQYIQRGVKYLYVHRADEDLCKEFMRNSARSIFEDPKSTVEKKIASLLNMTEQNISEVFSQMNVSEETAMKTKQVVQGYVDLMAKSPQTLATILKLVAHGDYLYYHSIAVAIFSIFIARASGQFNQRMMEIVGLGGFLHDIGETQLPKELVCNPNAFTDEQWTEMKEHPKLGMQMIETTPNIPDEVRYIVYQHHEQPGGDGYPNHLHSPVIYYPAKIVALADALSALISKRPHRPSYTIEEAIEMIRKDAGKFDRQLVDVMVGVFLKDSAKKKSA